MKLIKNIKIRFKEEDRVKSGVPYFMLSSRTHILLNAVTWGEYFLEINFRFFPFKQPTLQKAT